MDFMKIGLVGLGKMGFNLGLNLLGHGHEVVVYDINEQAIKAIELKGGIASVDLADMLEKLGDKAVIWIMIPSGKLVDDTIDSLMKFIKPGSIIIDGGNSNYKDSIRRYKALKTQDIGFLDCGTSGGTSGALEGACTMIGGEDQIFNYCEELFKDISVENGYLHVGAPGSGHFAKMVHNGIEYGMMQSIAEGFEILQKSEFDIDYEKISKVWNNGSVIRSWLMELTESAFSKDEKLEGIKGIMQSSGEGKWTIEAALDLQVPAPVITMSLMMRYRSLQEDTFAGKVVAALRNEFGGHEVTKK
jgi:6-phosphogluconate dehydrogenase